MSDYIHDISLDQLRQEFQGISRFREIKVREISDDPDDLAVSFETHKSDKSLQTPTGPHVFLVNRVEFVAELRKLLALLDPTVDQMTLRVLERIEKNLG